MPELIFSGCVFMKILKRLIAFFVISVILISGLGTVCAETVTFEKIASIDISGSAYLTCTSDRYLFSALGDSAKYAVEIQIYEKETLKYLTSITAQHPETINLAVNAMHIKGDYLYATFIQGAKGGNPLVRKYNIKEIYENKDFCLFFLLSANNQYIQ